tara:strand:- start:35419 stop:35883 length:465 start_codon:yes stop_codon:yes gene_type:complete
MERKSSRRRILCVVSVISFSGVLAPMGGCENSPLRGILQSRTAMDLLSPLVKDAANAYISDLMALSQRLDNLDSLQGVMEFVSEIQPTIDTLNTAYKTLANTTGDERRWLLEAFGPKIDSVNSAFISGSDGVTENWAWNKVLEKALDQVQLFEE